MPLPSRSFLQHSILFECFPPSVRNAIYANSEYRSYKKGDYVFHDGDEGPYFMGAVMSGRLRIEIRTREGKSLIVCMVEKGEIFGELSVFDELPRVVDMIVEEDSTIMIIKREDFLPHLMNCPEAILNLFKVSCRRRRMYVRMIELLALQTVKQKLARYLLQSVQDYGTVKGNATVINSRLSQADIGAQLGITRESVNKNLNAFAEQGLLVFDNETITLLDIRGLKDAIRADEPKEDCL